MINILIITFLVVAIVICFIMLSMCNVIKDTDIRCEEIRQDLLKNKRMANAEPEEYRCRICAKNFLDGGPFKRYKRALFCLDCYNQFVKLKKENEFNRTAKLLNVEVK